MKKITKVKPKKVNVSTDDSWEEDLRDKEASWRREENNYLSHYNQEYKGYRW